MHLKFNKDRWIKDKRQFSDLDSLDIEIMDETKDYFFAFMDAPIDSYLGHIVTAKRKLFNSKNELISYIKDNDSLMILYCIYKQDERYLLRFGTLPNPSDTQ